MRAACCHRFRKRGWDICLLKDQKGKKQFGALEPESAKCGFDQEVEIDESNVFLHLLEERVGLQLTAHEEERLAALEEPFVKNREAGNVTLRMQDHDGAYDRPMHPPPEPFVCFYRCPLQDLCCASIP